MSNTPGVTVRNDSTDVVDILGSVEEPVVQTIQSGHQRADDNQKWGWIYHCDEIIGNLPIGLA